MSNEGQNLKITIKDILKRETDTKAEDYFSLAEGIYDRFDLNAYNKGQGYSSKSFPLFDKHLEGLDEGLVIFAGESNSGKSAAMMNMLWAYSANPANKLFALYISLDDSVQEIIARIISMNKLIPISVSSKPAIYAKYVADNRNSDNAEILAQCDIYTEYLTKREEGLNELRDANERFLVIDRETVKDLDQIIDYITKVRSYIKAHDPEADVIVGIDSMADIAVSGKFNTDREKVDHVVCTLKHTANNVLKIPILVSYHLRKLNRAGRPTMNDIKESGKVGYEASLIILVHNDVSQQKQAATIFLSEPDSNEKLPVLEFDWAKNKKSSFKGRTYYAFSPNFSKIIECSHEVGQRFDALVYTK